MFLCWFYATLVITVIVTYQIDACYHSRICRNPIAVYHTSFHNAHTFQSCYPNRSCNVSSCAFFLRTFRRFITPMVVYSSLRTVSIVANFFAFGQISGLRKIHSPTILQRFVCSVSGLLILRTWLPLSHFLHCVALPLGLRALLFLRSKVEYRYVRFRRRCWYVRIPLFFAGMPSYGLARVKTSFTTSATVIVIVVLVRHS